MGYPRNVRLITEAKVPMRDGVDLAATVCLPVGPDGQASEGSYPVVLVRTAYNRTIYVSDRHARQGLVYVVQDCRGRYGSDGEFYPWFQEENDGLDTLDWIAAQPWCNGRIAMYGDSYLAGVQYAIAKHNHPNLVALNPRFMPAELWHHCFYCGGAFSTALVYSWLCLEVGGRTSSANLLPLLDIPGFLRELPVGTLDEKANGFIVPAYRDFVAHETEDEYWKSLRWIDRFAEVTTPMLLTGGWYDNYPGEAFAAYLALTGPGSDPAIAAQHRLLVGPWTHGIYGGSKLGDLDFGEASLAEDGHTDRWLECMLKGGSPAEFMEAPIRIFVMGLNQWRDEYEWPLARTRFTEYYLRSGGVLRSERPDAESPDQYSYDPADPTPTLGGNHSVGPYNPGLYELALPGPIDQRPVEARDDVLTYTGEVLDQDLEATGPVTVKLYASSSAVDTDFVARLCDVYPDGRSILITEGILRARYRDRQWDHPQPLEPGRAYLFEIVLETTSNVFLKGHRLRLNITSSNFPLWNRNLNTGEPLATGAAMCIAEQTIHHDAEHPSHILLPVVRESR